MATVLVTTGAQSREPGANAHLRALRKSLPEWNVQRMPREQNLRTWLSAAESADAVVLAGGTLFDNGRHRASPLGSTRTLMLALYARLRNKPLAMIGLGLEPPSTAAERTIARELVRSSDLLVLRDSDSAEALGRAGAPVPFRIGADTAWAAFDRPLAAPIEGRAVLVVVTSNGADDHLVAFLDAALSPLVAEAVPVHLQPWTERDVVVARAVAARFPARLEVWPPPDELVSFGALCAGHRTVVAGSVAALIAAGAAGVPFVALAGEPGTAGVARRLAQQWLGADATRAELTEAVRSAMRRQGPSDSAVQSEIDGAHQTLRLLRVLLSGGRSEDADAVSGLSLEPSPWR